MPFQPYFFNDTPTVVEQITKNTYVNEQQSADISALRNDVDTTLADLDKNIKSVVLEKLNEWNEDGSLRSLISNKKILLVGDSYLWGVGLPVADMSTQNYGALLSARGFDITPLATSGGGFAAVGNTGTYGGGTFLTMLQQFVSLNEQSVLDSYTDILFLEGINDSYNTSALYSQLYSTITYANDNFKNAICHIGYISETRRPEANILGVMTTKAFYKQVCNNVNVRCCYINNSEYMLKNYGSINIFDPNNPLNPLSDGTHPTAQGQRYICNYLTSYLLNGNISITNIITPLSLSLSDYVTTGVFQGTITQNNNIIRLSVLNSTAFSSNQTNMPVMPFDGTSSVIIGQFNNSFIWGQSDSAKIFSGVQGAVPGTISYYKVVNGKLDTDTIITEPCAYTFRMIQNTVFLTPQLLNSPAQFTSGKIVQMNTNPFSIVFSADDC